MHITLRVMFAMMAVLTVMWIINLIWGGITLGKKCKTYTNVSGEVKKVRDGMSVDYVIMHMAVIPGLLLFMLSSYWCFLMDQNDRHPLNMINAGMAACFILFLFFLAMIPGFATLVERVPLETKHWTSNVNPTIDEIDNKDHISTCSKDNIVAMGAVNLTITIITSIISILAAMIP